MLISQAESVKLRVRVWVLNVLNGPASEIHTYTQLQTNEGLYIARMAGKTGCCQQKHHLSFPRCRH